MYVISPHLHDMPCFQNNPYQSGSVKSLLPIIYHFYEKTNRQYPVSKYIKLFSRTGCETHPASASDPREKQKKPPPELSFACLGKQKTATPVTVLKLSG